MFRGANRFELDQIMEVYARARALMAQNGNPTQWGDNYPSRQLIEEDILSNRLFVCVINGELEAVFAFILGEDPTYKKIEDGQWLANGPYGTLHRLASAGHRTVRACGPTPTPTTRSCSTCWSPTASPAAASSMWPTAAPASLTRSWGSISWPTIELTSQRDGDRRPFSCFASV